MLPGGKIATEDLDLIRVCDDPRQAADHIAERHAHWQELRSGRARVASVE
jgi:hypothetical protein